MVAILIPAALIALGIVAALMMKEGLREFPTQKAPWTSAEALLCLASSMPLVWIVLLPVLSMGHLFFGGVLSRPAVFVLAIVIVFKRTVPVVRKLIACALAAGSFYVSSLVFRI